MLIMAISSFDRDFVVTGEAARKFLYNVEHDKTIIKIKRKDLKKESKRGIKLLKKAL